MTHPFWGELRGDTTVGTFAVPGFTPAVTVSFGNARVPKTELTTEALDDYAEVFQRFVAVSESLLPIVREEVFDYYNRVYAHYFEHPEVSGEPALGLSTPEEHYTKLIGLLGVAMSVNRSVELDFDYAVDDEHGLAVMFVDHDFFDVGGIADLAPGEVPA